MSFLAFLAVRLCAVNICASPSRLQAPGGRAHTGGVLLGLPVRAGYGVGAQ